MTAASRREDDSGAADAGANRFAFVLHPLTVDYLANHPKYSWTRHLPRPLVEAGRLRVVAVTTRDRLSILPQVPAIAETYAGFDMASWVGLGAPLGTPPEVLATLTRATADFFPAILISHHRYAAWTWVATAGKV